MENVNRKKNKNIFYFLLVLVLLRPSLDLLSRWEFQIHQSIPSFNFNTLIGGLVFIVIGLFLIKNIKSIHSIPLFYIISIFLGLTFFSIFYSIDSFNSIREFIRIASIFFLYFLAYKVIENKKDWQILLTTILVSYALPSIFALIQLIFGLGLPDDFGGFERIYGTFTHPNLFAFYTFFILGLTLCLALAKKDLIIKNNYLWILVVGLTFLLFATYTRSAIACFFIFLIIFGIFKYRELLLISMALFLIAYFSSSVFQERFWDLIALDPTGSIVWRFRLWKDVLPIALWQPWLGYGTGTFTNLVEFYRGFSWGSLDAHNDYLKILVENGILGLAAYSTLIITLLFKLLKVFKKALSSDKTIALGILAISLSLFAAGFFDNILRTTALQWNLWILLAGWLKINK